MPTCNEYPLHQMFHSIKDIEDYMASVIKINFNMATKTGESIAFSEITELMAKLMTDFIYEEIMMAFDEKENNAE